MGQPDNLADERIHQLEVKLWVERQELALLGPYASEAAREEYTSEARRLQDELNESYGKLHSADRGQQQSGSQR